MSAAPAIASRFRPKPRYRRIGLAVMALIIAADLVLSLYVARAYYLHPRTDDAYVRANIVGIAPQVSGTLVELAVHDNEHVKFGQLLFQIDPRPYQADLDLAQARLTLANLEIDALNHAIAAAKSRQVQAEADASYDAQYLNRIQ